MDGFAGSRIREDKAGLRPRSIQVNPRRSRPRIMRITQQLGKTHYRSSGVLFRTSHRLYAEERNHGLLAVIGFGSLRNRSSASKARLVIIAFTYRNTANVRPPVEGD
jgi:hypothetical protein